MGLFDQLINQAVNTGSALMQGRSAGVEKRKRDEIAEEERAEKRREALLREALLKLNTEKSAFELNRAREGYNPKYDDTLQRDLYVGENVDPTSLGSYKTKVAEGELEGKQAAARAREVGAAETGVLQDRQDALGEGFTADGHHFPDQAGYLAYLRLKGDAEPGGAGRAMSATMLERLVDGLVSQAGGDPVGAINLALDHTKNPQARELLQRGTLQRAYFYDAADRYRKAHAAGAGQRPGTRLNESDALELLEQQMSPEKWEATPLNEKLRMARAIAAGDSITGPAESRPTGRDVAGRTPAQSEIPPMDFTHHDTARAPQKPLEVRVAELKAAGVSKEQARRILAGEGYRF